MALSDASSNDLGLFLFNSTALSALGTSWYVSLHTGDPHAGDQETSEADYTGYDRVDTARDDSSDWTVTSNDITNANEIAFGTCTAGSNTITHVGLGTASSGGGVLWFVAALDTSLSVSTSENQTPRFVAGALDFTFVADAT